jgi:hypothetical protein
MPRSMAVRVHLAVGLLLALAGCGGDGEGDSRSEVRLLAPAGVAPDTARFERESGCRVDVRVYDDEEDVAAIARRRDVDVVAGPVPPGGTAHFSEPLVRITIAKNLELTVPKRLASAFNRPARPAGRRSLAWSIRPEGEDDACARRWLAHVTSH